eukprot:545039_1
MSIKSSQSKPTQTESKDDSKDDLKDDSKDETLASPWIRSMWIIFKVLLFVITLITGWCASMDVTAWYGLNTLKVQMSAELQEAGHEGYIEDIDIILDWLEDIDFIIMDKDKQIFMRGEKFQTGSIDWDTFKSLSEKAGY